MAELAQMDPRPHYEKYLKISNNKFKKQNVALSLIRLSKNKNKEFQKYKSLLKDNSAIYLAAGMYAYDEKPTSSLKTHLLSQKGASQTFEGQMLIRENTIEQILKDAKTLQAHKLESETQIRLERSIQKRVSLLGQFEKRTQQIITSKDFTLQFVALEIAARENKRLAQDVLKLPAPKDLKKAQIQEYKKLVSEQVKPYQEKYLEIKSKLAQLWSSKENSSFEDVLVLSTQYQSPGYKTAQKEVQVVRRVAQRQGFDISELTKIRQQRQKMSQKLGELKNKVKKNPFDSSYLKEMKDIEERLNAGPMVAYLNSRIDLVGGQN
jgi:uncharacterized protein (DUF1330 family)